MASGPGRDEYLVLQMSMGHYRQRFLDELESQGFPVRFLVGDQGFDDHSPTELDSSLVESTGPNIMLFGRRIGLQRGVFLRAVKAPVVVVLLNPRIATTWAVGLARRVLGRPTLAWGHAWPRRGQQARSDLARVVLRRIPTAVLVYTETEKAQLQARWPSLRVYVAPNSVYPAHEMQPAAPSGAEPRNILWIGRMIEAKRPLLAIEGFERAVDDLPESCRLVMVGSGPELDAVRERARTSPCRDRIDLTGQITEHAALEKIFGDAVATLSTGYLGLNATQSVGFGVPVVHPDDEPHAPELEALDESNSRSFRARDVAGLAEAVVDVVRERDKWFARREEISRRARSRYSSEAMARGLIEAIEAVAGGAA
jgi:glycosyltransferase involved in cell wall biosynthesis